MKRLIPLLLLLVAAPVQADVYSVAYNTVTEFVFLTDNADPEFTGAGSGTVVQASANFPPESGISQQDFFDVPLQCLGNCDGLGENFYQAFGDMGGGVQPDDFSRADAVIDGEISAEAESGARGVAEVQRTQDEANSASSTSQIRLARDFTVAEASGFTFRFHAVPFLGVAAADVSLADVLAGLAFSIDITAGDTLVFSWAPDGVPSDLHGGTEVLDPFSLNASRAQQEMGDKTYVPGDGTFEAVTDALQPGVEYTLSIVMSQQASVLEVDAPGEFACVSLAGPSADITTQPFSTVLRVGVPADSVEGCTDWQATIAVSRCDIDLLRADGCEVDGDTLECSQAIPEGGIGETRIVNQFRQLLPGEADCGYQVTSLSCTGGASQLPVEGNVGDNCAITVKPAEVGLGDPVCETLTMTKERTEVVVGVPLDSTEGCDGMATDFYLQCDDDATLSMEPEDLPPGCVLRPSPAVPGLFAVQCHETIPTPIGGTMRYVLTNHFTAHETGSCRLEATGIQCIGSDSGEVLTGDVEQCKASLTNRPVGPPPEPAPAVGLLGFGILGLLLGCVGFVQHKRRCG